MGTVTEMQIILIILFLRIIHCQVFTITEIVNETVFVAPSKTSLRSSLTDLITISPTTLTSTSLPTAISTPSVVISIASSVSNSLSSASMNSLSISDIYRDIFSYSGPYFLNSTFAKLMLDATNYKRSLHGATILSWNSTVFNYAANYTQVYDCSGILKHSGGSFGENLAIGYTPKAAIEAWYDEGSDYQYGTENTYNHFTALIWNSTTQIGCDYKYCNEVWGDYVVCSYFTEGNVIGYSSQNVFPLLY